MNRNVIIGGIAVCLLVAGVIFWPKHKNVETSEGVRTVSKSDIKQLHKQAAALKQDRKLIESKEAYQNILTEHPNVENVETIQKELEKVNLDIIFTNTPAPEAVVHEVAVGDTIGKIAKKYGTTVDLIKRCNNLSTDTIRVGQKLRVWTGKFSIFVDKSQNILILKTGEDVVKVYSVSTGTNNSTPVGTFTITSKLVDPVWFHNGAVVPPESPQNVLGSRWMGFDMPGYGIHGTVDPESIGQQVTAGCVRMRNEEVEELYTLVPAGTQVVIVD